MYFYFDESKYLVSTRKHPYISIDQIKRHNDSVRNIKKLTKKGAEQLAVDGKNRTAIGLTIGLVPCIILFLALADGESGVFGALYVVMFASILFLGVSYGISQNLPPSNELQLLEAEIKERVECMDRELLDFEALKKKNAQYWLNMDGWRFEREVAKLYEAYGYDTIVTKGSDDGGIDIFLKKNGARFGVQCKNHHKPVAQVVIRELYGAMLHENLDGGVVIASSGYTKRAKEFAKYKAIKLLDINDVLIMHANTLTK